MQFIQLAAQESLILSHKSLATLYSFSVLKTEWDWYPTCLISLGSLKTSQGPCIRGPLDPGSPMGYPMGVWLKILNMFTPCIHFQCRQLRKLIPNMPYFIRIFRDPFWTSEGVMHLFDKNWWFWLIFWAKWDGLDITRCRKPPVYSPPWPPCESNFFGEFSRIYLSSSLKIYHQNCKECRF